MAHPYTHDAQGHGAHDPNDTSDPHGHPTAGTYVKVGIILTLITVAEVWAYYIPSLVAQKGIFISLLLILSAVKFVTVVLFYMHLKYDHRLFRALFTGPFVIAALTLIGLMFLFGHLSIRLGLLS